MILVAVTFFGLLFLGLPVGFVLGIAVKTGMGRFVQQHLEARILAFAPGYKLIKETVLQFMGRKKSPFSSVALVQLYESRTMVTAFITDDEGGDHVTVFVPTGPNPTSGQIFHVERQFVHPADVGVEEAMRSIISCGAGSGALLSKKV